LLKGTKILLAVYVNVNVDPRGTGLGE